MVIEFLLKQFDPLFVYEYTENMEKKLDDISKGESKWQRFVSWSVIIP